MSKVKKNKKEQTVSSYVKKEKKNTTEEKTYFSKRIPKNRFTVSEILAIQKALHTFNQGKHEAYSILLDKHNKKPTTLPRDTSLHMYIKNEYDMNDYFANSVVREAQAVLNSQKETHDLHMDNVEGKIETAENKVKDLEKQLKNKQSILDSILKGKVKFPKGVKEGQQGRFYIVRLRRKTLLFGNVYLFEHQYVRTKIKFIKNQIHRIKEYIQRLKGKLEFLQKELRGVTFGGKKLFKAQFTNPQYVNNHQEWRKDFEKARYSSMKISGRFDAIFGNFVFKYTFENSTLLFQLSDGTVIQVKDLKFPYGQKEINAYLEKQRTEKAEPMAWEIEDHGNYYIFKAIVHLPKNEHVNYYKGKGVIGIDCNYDHLAWAEVDERGELIDFGTLPFSLFGKSTGQSTKILEQIAVEMIKIANKKGKPIVIEKLDTKESKSRLRYKNSLSNRKITQFAYKKMISALKSRANKEGVGVFEVNPAYTSQIGKMKYMKQKGISIHISASYVIARRGMSFDEKVPKHLLPLIGEKRLKKHHWSHWSFLTKELKEVKVHSFFSLDKSMVDAKCKKVSHLVEKLKAVGE